MKLKLNQVIKKSNIDRFQLAYENTYQLEPYLHQQFSVKRIQDIIKAVFIQKLENVK